MPILNVHLAAGRSDKLKAELARRLTDTVCEVLGSPKAAVRVLLHEVPPENWFAAGTSLSDRDQSGAT